MREADLVLQGNAAGGAFASRGYDEWVAAGAARRARRWTGWKKRRYDALVFTYTSAGNRWTARRVNREANKDVAKFRMRWSGADVTPTGRRKG